MRKCDELALPESCLNKARDDELLFVLLGRDVAAPNAVLAWISERLLRGKNRPGDEQIVEAWRWVDAVKLQQGVTAAASDGHLRAALLGMLLAVRECGYDCRSREVMAVCEKAEEVLRGT